MGGTLRKIGSPLLSFLLCSLCTPLQIILRIKEVKNNLVIKIKNAFNNEIRYNKEELMSTKEGHSGLGIKSVKSVVSKYQGEIRMDITDNMFSVLIIIPFHP